MSKLSPVKISNKYTIYLYKNISVGDNVGQKKIGNQK